MKIVALPMLYDNYGWLLVDETAGRCAVVDPSQAEPVAERVRREDLQLGWILATHHHFDHVAGTRELVRRFPEAEVLCSEQDRSRIALASGGLGDGQRVAVAGAEAVCFYVPGHTRGSMAYYFPKEKALFTGDTLFLAGCGRLFEGKPVELFASLTHLSRLPGDTLVCCGHEYTEENLRFAAAVEPDNEAVQQRLEQVQALRAQDKPSVPGTLAVERATNPFLRTHERVLQELAGSDDPVAVFAELRRTKDRF